MKNRKQDLRNIAETLGATWMILWLLVLGPVGLLAWLGLCYSMMVQNAVLGAVCAIILGSPLVTIAAWGLFAWRAIVQEERAEAQGTPSWVAPAKTTDRIAA